MDATKVRPVLVGGPPEAQDLAPIEVGPDEQEIRLAIGGTNFIWIRDEPIDGTGPVIEQYFRLMAMSQYRDAETLAELRDRIARLDAQIARLDAQIARLDAEIDRLDDYLGKDGPPR